MMMVCVSRIDSVPHLWPRYLAGGFKLSYINIPVSPGSLRYWLRPHFFLPELVLQGMTRLY